MFDFDPKKDYYAVLWVTETATDDEIKKAFRKLAMKYHPDRGWDQEKFKEINEAYQIVWDQNKKQQYDSIRKWGGWYDFGWGGWWFGGGWFSGGNFDFWGFGDVFDIFWDFMWWSSGRAKNKVKKWQDIQVNLHISFEESYKWTSKEFKYNRHVHCHECDGKWIDRESQQSKCTDCNWTWTVRKNTQTPFGVMQVQTGCTKCGGDGYLNSKVCKHCNGEWLTKKEEKINANIPAGIEDGSMIKYSGMWNAWAKWWPYGDMFIKIIVKSFDGFIRRWNDIYTELSVNVLDMVLWGEYLISHPDGKIKVKIPKWTQIWNVIKVSGKWFKKSWNFSGHWDLIVVPKVSIPKKLSKEEEKLWSKLKELV